MQNCYQTALHQQREHERRALLLAQGRALLAGQPDLAPRSTPELRALTPDTLSRRMLESVQERQLEAMKLQIAAEATARQLLAEGRALEGYRVLRSYLAQLERSDPQKALEQALGYAQKLLQRLGGSYTPQQRRVAVKLLWLALEVGLREPRAVSGHHQHYVYFHARQYELQMALFPEQYSGAKPLETAHDAAEQALRRTLNAMTRAGMLTRRRHIGNARDRASGRKLPWADGTLFKLCLRPGARPPRLQIHELTAEYADLERETTRHWTQRRTARAALLRRRVNLQINGSETETTSPNGEVRVLRALLDATVNVKKPWGVRFFVSDQPVDDLRQTLEPVRKAPLHTQAAWVAEIARKFAHGIHDGHSVGHWALVLWRALQAALEGRDLLEVLQRGAAELLAAQQRRWVRRPGAWLRCWLRRNGGAELVQKMPRMYPWQRPMHGQAAG